MTNKLNLGDKVKIPILNVCGMYIGRCSRGHKVRLGLMDIIVTSPPKKAHIRRLRRRVTCSNISDSMDDYINDKTIEGVL